MMMMMKARLQKRQQVLLQQECLQCRMQPAHRSPFSQEMLTTLKRFLLHRLLHLLLKLLLIPLLIRQVQRALKLWLRPRLL
jgi:hypothetical protein